MMKMIQEEDDTQGSSHSESSEESEVEITSSGLHSKAEEENVDSASSEEACASVAASLLFFCKKRGSWLLGCFTTMVISAALFVLNKVLGQWQLREEILDNGSVEKTYEPGNNSTFLLLVVSILLFQASLSVLLVLFVYVYKRDIQEQQGMNQNASGNASQELSLADEYALLQLEQPHLFSSSTREERGTPFRESLLYYFYQKHTAYIHAIGSLLFASIVFLIVPKACSRHPLVPLLLGVVLLLASGTLASCLLYFHLNRTLKRYQSRRTFQRQLSLDSSYIKGATALPPKGSLTLLQLLNFLVHATVFWALVVQYRPPLWSFVLVTLLSSVACISWYLWVGPVAKGSTTGASSLETCSETELADEDSAGEAAEMV